MRNDSRNGMGSKTAAYAEGARAKIAVRHQLVDTLFIQPLVFSIVIAVIFGFCVFTAVLSGSEWQQGLTAALGAVLVVRVYSVFRMRPGNGTTYRKAEAVFMASAYGYALLLGAMAFHAIVASQDQLVLVLLVMLALMYGLALTMRYGALPYLAIGQMVLSVGPPLIGFLIRGDVISFVLAGGLAIVMLVTSNMSVITARVFIQSLSTGEASQRIASRMQHLARTDVVTGLANRAGLNHLMVELVMGVPQGGKLALLWLDLDRFKEVNDTMGHPVGDRVLAEVASRLQDCAPADGVVARFGGDEFIMAAHVGDEAGAAVLGEHVLERLRRPIRIEGDRLQIGASIGIALMPDNGSNLDELMQHADLALYDAKVKGRNRCSFFQAEMNSKLCKRREIEADLRQAIERDELTLFFQPIVDLETGRIRSFEALMRWFHPARGEIRPDEFIPVAEESGLIITLGNWITQQAAATCSRWPEHVSVAVNLSPVQIRAPGSALAIRSAIRQAGLDPSRMVLEVTESLFLEDEGGTRAFIDELADDGIRFALDDFGTGYSSLGYIDRYPFSKIKVDRSFVSGKDVGRKSEAIIYAVAELGKQLGMEIVAEGLETAEQVAAVRAAGCTLGQGWHFSKAVPDYVAAMLLAEEDTRLQPGPADRAAG